MTASLVAVVTDAYKDGRRVIGYGFNSNGRYAQGGPLRDRFAPRLLRADPVDLVDDNGHNLSPARVWAVLMRNEKPGGHGERSVAVGVLDMAVWDIVAKVEGVSLAHLLASRFGNGKVRDRVPVYAAGGYYYPTHGHDALKDEIRGYLDRGYTSVKIKIGGASLDEDLRRIDAVLSVVNDPRALAVDANGRFSLELALEYAASLDRYGLRWFEEPSDPLDFYVQSRVAEAYGGPLATGENLFAAIEVRNLLRYGGLRPDRDVLQMDPVLSYGLVEFLRMLEELRAFGWSPERCNPHGGHQMNLAIAAGIGLGGIESYPGLFQPFGGFADSTEIVDGTAAVVDVAGVGLEAKAELWRLCRELTHEYV